MNLVLKLAAIVVLWASHNSAIYHEQPINLKAFKPKPESGLNDTSLFGFSLAYQKKHKRLIISAPKADRIGKLFSCTVTDIKNTNYCEEWFIAEDSKYLDYIRTGEYIKINNKPLFVDSWFGATVSASSSYFMACAPRLLNKCPDNLGIYGTIGHCYVNDATKNNNSMRKLENMNRHDENYGVEVCNHRLNSFGWSSEVNDQGTFIAGGPATHKAGALVYEGLSQSLSSEPLPIYGRYHGNVYNLGYSVAIDKFFGEESVYALGSPYGDHGVGGVYFFSKRPSAVRESVKNNNEFYELLLTLTDTGSPGSMFAAVLCAAKLNYQSIRRALLVGAPAFFDGDLGMYEVGAVHVYYDLEPSADKNVQVQIKPKWIIKGTQTGGRFGMAIANIGDMDNDMLDDIVIAAPYEENGRGAIYLYPGSTFTGSKVPVHIQRIAPNERTKNFGFSLAPLVEFDRIGRSGLAVGGFGDPQVAFLHYIPTFQVKVTVDHPNLLADHKLKQFTINVCIECIFPEKPDTMTAEITMKLKVIHKTAKLMDTEGNLYETLYEVTKTDNKKCVAKQIDISKVGDYVFDPIIYRASVSQTNKPMNDEKFDGTQAILLEQPSNRLHGSVFMKSDCEIPASCKPELAVTVQSSMSEPYVVGSSGSELITVTVTNSNDTAYEPCLSLSSSEGTTLLGSHEVDGKKYRPNSPVRKGSPWVTQVSLKTDRLTSNQDVVNITATAYSNCSVQNSATKPEVLSRKLQYDSENVNLHGENEARLNHIKVNEKKLAKGKRLAHEYYVFNNGKTTWMLLEFKVELKNQPYLTYGDIEIYDDFSNPRSCKVGQGDINITLPIAVTCDLGDLRPGQRRNIHVPIQVQSTNKYLFYGKVNITSNIIIERINKTKSTETVVELVKTKVDKWVIIVACLFGILLLLLIALALYKCGFLKRKKKEELKVLIRRESIRRQSIRQSAHEDQMARRASVLSKRNSIYGALYEESVLNPRLSTAAQRNSAAEEEPSRNRKSDQSGSTNNDSTIEVNAEVHI